MTIAQLVESLAGKRMCASPLANMKARSLFEQEPSLTPNKRPKVNPDTDGTPFAHEFSLNRIVAELKAMGVDGFGKEIVTNGLTGEIMPSMVFYGPVYYQRLKHMVIDKVHARAEKGGRTALTRQPREGRARQGGLKVGMMEKDNINAQGCAGFVRDRMLEQSNDYRMWVCSLCGIAVVAEVNGTTKPCALCESTEAVQVRIPYSTKLLTQELTTANIVNRMVGKPFEEDKIEI